MATRSNMKGFYKQKKSTIAGGVSKKKKTQGASAAAASLGSDVTQPSALISHGAPDLKDDYDEQEEVLRQFDLNTAYGPCFGITRLARWERACKLGMDPPKEVENLLKSGKARLECLWDGRI
ncbi:putative DNA polymerase delta, subunit 4 [Rosa chinensis]|uniref:Putative DNA polymerase delta, subunit 4 n=1 Tax=Rosa chinensis TaxID=74649 RepID=A0A2P6RRF2_ROSCH|nr:DNA polymerase delta subunit 4 [Rosa chinensis]PRQ49009.1 putative DNA polymerase delta, subunit 4 [Rosa chinensis]